MILGDAGVTRSDRARPALLSRSALLAVLGALLLMRLLLMAWLPLTDTTEARYAEIARKMVETGDWITPQFAYGVPFWGKPPLHTWASALGMKLFGVGAFSARLFIFGSALVALALLFGWVRRLRGTDAALMSVTICASTVMFFGAAAFVMTDMVMVMSLVLAMVGFHEATVRDPGNRLWGHLFFAGLGLGMLAKGPVAVVLAGIALVLWLAMGRRWQLLRHLPWASGTALALVIFVPWYVAAELKTPGFLRYFFIGEHFERFVVPGWRGDLYGSGHVQPKGKIWLYALGVLLPWTVPAAAIALVGLRRRARGNGAEDSLGGYLFAWALAPLILFTPAANILPAYVLPAVPAFSVWLALAALRLHAAGVAWIRPAILLSLAFSFCVILGVTWAARHAPERVGLRTMDGLVAAIEEAAPGVAVAVYPGRSYSAEFYTDGRAQVAEDLEALAALRENGRRDAVIVAGGDRTAALQTLGERFREVARYRKAIALIEEEE